MGQRRKSREITLQILYSFESYQDFNKLSEELKKAERQEQFYENEIRKDSIQLHELETNKEYLKKFAREEYRMKKDDETIFLIIRESEND